VSFKTLRSFNIHELDAASNNKVEDIRSLNDQVRIPPQIGKYSIYIIDEVHMLSSSAFNAFLKTLEEPPSHAIFILATTEKHKIIPTILSRCQIFDFNRIRIEDIVGRLMYVAKKEGVTAHEEALHVIGQKADGAMRDALSIFDQIVSLSGKTITYNDVIDNLNVLDYEYFFKCIEGAMAGDVSSVLLTFNEILVKGFDGHNFISGLNSHLRDLLVSKDISTLRLLETTPAIKQRYLQQTGECPVDFIYKALEIGNNCDLAYKSSKNPRLHVELALIRICMLIDKRQDPSGKKKPDSDQLDNTEEDIQPPSKSEIIRDESKVIENKVNRQGILTGKHDPVIEKPSKTFSIKEIISEDAVPVGIQAANPENLTTRTQVEKKIEFSPDTFEVAWKEFMEQLNGEGPRIMSMFKSIRPELENDKIIRIHLNNAAQKDMFVQNYKHRLITFLEKKFILEGIDIETTVDLSESNELLYTDDQKYSYLLTKYPILKEMKKTFNLDIT
jgi:DNA polymerase-3 subunit gamma/tau